MSEVTRSTYVCVEPGCTRGRDSGHALYRTSAKGELFEGKCEEHFPGLPDPVAKAVEQRNQELR